MWRFWKWPRPPVDQFTAMALLVRATDAEYPEWGTITIKRNPEGGVTLSIHK
jgi:hypothetical protein